MVNTTVDNKQLVLIWGFVVYIEIHKNSTIGWLTFVFPCT